MSDEIKPPALTLLKFVLCKSDSMRHGPFVLDEESRTVTCKTCEKKMDPFHVLEIFCKEESWVRVRYSDNKRALDKLKAEYETKNKVKCEHCLKLTRFKK